MAISLTDLYDRLGKLMGIAKAQVDARSALIDRVTGSGSFSGVGLDGQYTAATRYMVTPVLDYFLNLYRTSDQSVQRAIAGGVKTLTEMVTADNGNIPKSVIPAMVELNRQMRAASQTLLQNTITQGSVSYAGGNVGNGQVLLHTIPSQMSCTETIRVECISDTTTGAALGREVFRVTGGLRNADVTSNLWQGGSGANLTLASSDYVDSQNQIVNGSFESWAGGVPNNWTVLAGALSISQLSVGAFRGTSAIQHDGVANTQLQQILPPLTLPPGRRIIFGFWYKRVSGVGSASDIELELLDSTGSTYAVATQGTITTSWQLAVTSITNPVNAPSVTLEAFFNFPIDPGVTKAVDAAFVFLPPQAGTNGQFIQIVGGSTDWRIGDYATVAITNNYASNVLTYTERFFAPFANGIELPVSGSPTIGNTVIP